MSLRDALYFPLQAKNLSKILGFILVYFIIVTSVMVLGLLSNRSELAMQVSSIISYAYTFFVMGYSIEVIRALMAGSAVLPPSSLWRDIKRGFFSMVALIVHIIPFIPLLLFSGFISQNLQFNRIGNNDNSMLLACGLLIAIPLGGFFIFNALFIGMMRYAAEDRARALFEFGTNVSLVRSNMRRLLSLIILSICVAVVYRFIPVFASVWTNQSQAITTTTSSQLGIEWIAGFVIERGISQTFAFIANMSVAYLQAQFGLITGFHPEKAKTEKKKL